MATSDAAYTFDRDVYSWPLPDAFSDFVGARTSAVQTNTGGDGLMVLLRTAAMSDAGLTMYSGSQNSELGNNFISYKTLLQKVEENASFIRGIPSLRPDSVVLIHFDNLTDNIKWFWSVLAAGFVPAISTPLVPDTTQRKKHLEHIDDLLSKPILLTREALVSEFLNLEQLNVITIERLHVQQNGSNVLTNGERAVPLQRTASSATVFMLTSGSTGNAKAVALSQAQIMASLAGKIVCNRDTKRDVILNWIGFDHVANLLECHLLAVALSAHQVHIEGKDLLVEPTSFLELIDQHRVTRSFAPNFFLDLLLRTVVAKKQDGNELKFDLSCLKRIMSGGEANVVRTAIDFAKMLSAFGAADHVLCMGFGLTESCGAITYWPFDGRYELASEREIASIGQPIPGARMRISADGGYEAKPNEVGNLELSGPIIFREYRNNPDATASAFTADGWFSTGDRALKDSRGNVVITGRTKELIIINGVKFAPQDIENALATSNIPGINPSYTAVFSHRPSGNATEEFCILFNPTYDLTDAHARWQCSHHITNVATTVTARKPFRIVPLPEEKLPKSALGKLSRAKLQVQYEQGVFREEELENERIIHEYRSAHRRAPSTETEKTVLKLICDILDLSLDEVGIDDDIFALGITSVSLIRFLNQTRKELDLHQGFGIVDLISNPNIRNLAHAVDNQHDQTYDPVVCLRSEGTKLPIWLMHPASGNIFGFLPLAKCFIDRPVYAIRTRGLNIGEEPFTTIAEAADVYTPAVKRVQPKGPYIISGYSLGTTIGFEVTKRLEAQGDEVAVLAAIDSPPHIIPLVAPLDWSKAAVMLSYFFHLIPEEDIASTMLRMEGATREDVGEHLLRVGAPDQVAGLNLDRTQLLRIVDVTNAFVRAAQQYEPEGSVRKVDCFLCTPLKRVCATKEEWMRDHLSKWEHFSREAPGYYDCGGYHTTLLETQYVRSFYGQLQSVLDERGV
ncbi:MAG: putative NRPS-like protein biosynthetic cluster [Bogoriella megaspora]|nr:MAG: putative NRPS-like protein biosynthetic cluster [Bogoriella megaspora]